MGRIKALSGLIKALKTVSHRFPCQEANKDGLVVADFATTWAGPLMAQEGTWGPWPRGPEEEPGGARDRFNNRPVVKVV